MKRLPPELPFRTRVAENYETMSRDAAAALVAQLRHQPDALWVLATGATPELTFRLLAEHGRAEPTLFSRLRIAKLDEWGGLDMDDPATCEVYLRRTLVELLGISQDRFFGWNSRPAELEAECARVRTWLERNGPPAVCVLGLGLNGHLGFNEPAAHLRLGPHRAELSEVSQTHGMVKAARRPPRFGLTLGMADIFRAREVYLLVSGAHKRGPLERFLRPELATEFPASLLWLHPGLTLFCDEPALGDAASEQVR